LFVSDLRRHPKGVAPKHHLTGTVPAGGEAADPGGTSRPGGRYSIGSQRPLHTMQGHALKGRIVMKRILLSTVAVAAAMAFVGSANAADIARPAPAAVKAPAYVAPVYLWSGFYVGGNVGYGWGDGSGTVTTATGTGPISGNGDGIIGGGQIGYNWQNGSFVFGVEADFQGSGVSGGFTGTPPATVITGTQRTPWFGTIRGRLGYAVNNWMFYVTGGGAYAKSEVSGNSTATGPFNASTTAWTYTVGAGIEAFVAPKWSVKAEYLYMGTPDSAPTVAGNAVSGSTNSNIIRVGANYHF
jgi:outer membrane immunogenic protein